MAQYSLLVLSAPLVASDKSNVVVETLETILKKLGGAVTLADDLGERQLAYRIKGADRGYYVEYLVDLEEKKAKELNKLLMLQKDIWRYLLIRVEEK